MIEISKNNSESFAQMGRDFDKAQASKVAEKYATEKLYRRVQVAGCMTVQEILVIPKDVRELMGSEDVEAVSRFYSVSEKPIQAPVNPTMSESCVDLFSGTNLGEV